MTLEKKGTSFLLSVPGLAENRPSVLKGDKVFIRNSDTRQVFETYVHQVLATQILLGVSPSLISRLDFDVDSVTIDDANLMCSKTATCQA